MQLKDISDIEVVEAYAEYKRFGGEFPYEILAKKKGCDQKLAYKACERAEKKGLIDYGVSLRTGWLTDKGKSLLLNGK